MKGRRRNNISTWGSGEVTQAGKEQTTTKDKAEKIMIWRNSVGVLSYLHYGSFSFYDNRVINSRIVTIN
jgi:hypothetical protein